ncbi:hypothetical protein KJZ99_07975 [bacterium]|nr:hypothetical protein [bacterium]
MGRRIGIILWLVLVVTGGSQAQELPDSLAKHDSVLVVKQSFDTTYVIPAGPIAGGFTDDSRIQVIDTVAGWARILVEGWVPVSKVLGRMSATIPDVSQKSKPDKPAKAERPQCAAQTSKGKQCSRKSIVGSKYCWQHSQ